MNEEEAANKVEAALILIESADTTYTQLVDAMERLYLTIFRRCQSTLPMRCLNTWLRVLASHADPVEFRELWLHLLGCLQLAVQWEEDRCIDSPAIAPLLAHECNPLALLLRALERCDKDDEELRERLSAAIAAILAMGSHRERKYIANRYCEPIKRAFHRMSSQDILLICCYGFDGFMMRETSVLEFIVNELRGTKTPEDLCDMSHVALDVMATAIEVDDSERLEHILGLGAMKSAAHLAVQGGRCRDAARKCADILNRHPEWNDYFKQSTKDGYPLGVTAVARRIIDRPKLPPTLYVLETTMEEQQEPSQTTVTSSQPAAVPKREPAASKEEEAEAAKEATFADLPLHFLIDMARTMSFAAMANFRLACKKTLAAVDERGRSLRALDIVRLAHELFPGKHGPGISYDSLHCLQHEITRLADWVGLDSINFTGVGTMNVAQLHTIFGTEPRPNVQKLDLVGVVVMPSVWSSLARLFPGVISVRCTEKSCQFPASIKQEAMLVDGEKIGGRDLVDRSGLVMKGLLGEERLITLRCIKMLFPDARYMHID